MHSSLITLFSKRINWLIFLFAVQAVTSNILKHFQSVLSSVVALSFFIPLFTDTGGNSGTQASSLIIRSLALGEVTTKDATRILIKELQVSAMPVSYTHLDVYKRQVIVNATSLGLKGEEISLPWEKLSPSVWIVDVVYRRGLTPLVREAKKRGIQSFDGKEMLLQQGAESFFLFTGEKAPLKVMEEALDWKPL